MDAWTLELRPGLREESASPAWLTARNFLYSGIVFFFYFKWLAKFYTDREINNYKMIDDKKFYSKEKLIYIKKKIRDEKFLFECPFDYTAFAVSGKVGIP